MWGLILENGIVKPIVIDHSNKDMLLNGITCKTTFDTLSEANEFIEKLYALNK